MKLGRAVLAASLLFAGVAPAGARSDPLVASCRSLDRAEFARCEIERRRGHWTLTTHVVTDGGSRRHVAELERRFCQTVRAHGVAGQVRRWQRIFAVPDGSALAEWSCGLPHVSQAPPPRR
jgi:hypothetical protein